LYAFEKLWGIPRPVRGNSTLARFSQYDGNLLGGLLLGFGMALSGACPGTTIVQMAQGVPSARSTIIGAVAGAAAYSRFGSLMNGKHSVYSNGAKRTLQDSTSLPGNVVLIVLGAAVAAGLYFPKVTDGQFTTTPLTGGLLIGGSQAASLFLTGNSLGVSTSYEQASRYILSALGASGIEKPNWPPRAMVFSLGIFAGSLALSSSGLLTGLGGPEIAIPAWQALLGGFVMVFGARTAGGCTSGHGISGLGALSSASLVTVAGAFGGGIALRSMMSLFENS
jgi:uncharacterized membrane protein YedE/YeeE